MKQRQIWEGGKGLLSRVECAGLDSIRDGGGFWKR